jgi:hypothetical protein
MTVEEAPRTPSLSELFALHEGVVGRSISCALPGRVEKYDSATQKADIKPLIKDRIPTRDGSELLEPLAVIPGVPIIFPRAGGFFITLPVAKDDLVTLIFCDRSIDNYKSGKGTDTDPDDFRMHDKTDAVAFPGFYPFSRSIGDSGVDSDLVLGKEDGAVVHITADTIALYQAISSGASIHIGGDQVNLYEASAADFVALALKVKTELDTIINDVNALKTVFSTWVTVPNDGGAALKAGAGAWFGAPLSASTSTAADKVKAT